MSVCSVSGRQDMPAENAAEKVVFEETVVGRYFASKYQNESRKKCCCVCPPRSPNFNVDGCGLCFGPDSARQKLRKLEPDFFQHCNWGARGDLCAYMVSNYDVLPVALAVGCATRCCEFASRARKSRGGTSRH